MSYGHWLKRDFYLRKTKKPFEHYNKVYGQDVPHRQEPHNSEPPKLTLLQMLGKKG